MKHHLVKLPLNSILLYLCVALFLTTGVTFSQYITSSHGDDHARVTKFGDLALYETVDGTTVNTQKLIYAPGVSIAKNPMVDFQKNELSAYVFVQIEAPGWQYTATDHRFAMINTNQTSAEQLQWSVDADRWTRLNINDEIVYYTYVPAGTELNGYSIIADNMITVSEGITNSQLDAIQSSIGKLSFTAFAVQAGGFENALSAWHSVSAQ